MTWDGFLNDKLKQRQYQYRNDAKRDILNAIRSFEDLHPEENVFISDETGKQATILVLTGTIPVNYKGSSYNIPVMIQLLHGHPHQAPLVYVKPTSTMVIKPSRHVDDKGRVYLPLLTDWQKPGMKSDLIELIKQLQIIFGQVPPVYAKSAQQPPPQQHRPPYPSPYPTTQQHGYHVPHGGMVMPQPQSHQPPPHHSGYPGSHQGYPSPQVSTPQYTSSYPGVTSSTPYPVPAPVRPANTTPYPTYPTSSQNTTPYPSTTTQSDLTRQGSVIDERMVRMSLLSTAEDKLKQSIRAVFEMGRIEQDQLMVTKVQLESGNKELTSMMQRMKDEQANLEANISVLDQKNTEIDTVLQKIEADSENINIDEAVVTTIPLHAQILDLYAEESAIEDTLYYLTEGLRREVVELDVFLKSVRKMSRKQFMLRATLLKAREVAGLR